MSRIRAIYVYFMCILFLIVISPLIVYSYLKYNVFNRKKNYKRIYKWAHIYYKYVLIINNVKLNVVGHENIKGIDPGYLVVANHQSYYDIPILGLIFKSDGVSFIAKKEIQKAWLLSHYMEVMDCYFLDRDSAKSGMNMIKKTSKLLEEGVNFVIFPEGTRTRDGNVERFKAASLKMATRSKSTIVPVSISQSFNLQPTSLTMNKGTVDVVIHKAITFEEYDELNAQEICDNVYETVVGGVEL